MAQLKKSRKLIGIASVVSIASFACASLPASTSSAATRTPMPTWTLPFALTTEAPSATVRATDVPAPQTDPSAHTNEPPASPTSPTPTITRTTPPTPTRLPVPTSTATNAGGSGETGVVVRVVDGDTIDVSIGGATDRVRYIGINTPESNEPCYVDAAAANAALVSGQTVMLVKDVSETDRYGRLLRYVHVGSLFVNADLVARGYAEAVAYPPNTAYADYFESLEAQARAANLNCYATGVFGGAVVASTPTLAVTLPTPTPQAVGNCDAAYPDVCIPPYPPDLDCGDIPYRRFRVLPPDPHGFDRDGDGMGCER